MKIQEMRSGLLHLPKRLEERRWVLPDEEIEESAADREPETFCELDVPQWAVLSALGCEGRLLTHDQATSLMGHLDQQGIDGLCLVTHASASSIATKTSKQPFQNSHSTADSDKPR